MVALYGGDEEIWQWLQVLLQKNGGEKERLLLLAREKDRSRGC
jgi:hypothetical protein